MYSFFFKWAFIGSQIYYVISSFFFFSFLWVLTSKKNKKCLIKCCNIANIRRSNSLRVFQVALFQEGTVKYDFYQCAILQFLEYISLEIEPNDENWRAQASTLTASWIVPVFFLQFRKKWLFFGVSTLVVTGGISYVTLKSNFQIWLKNMLIF